MRKLILYSLLLLIIAFSIEAMEKPTELKKRTCQMQEISKDSKKFRFEPKTVEPVEHKPSTKVKLLPLEIQHHLATFLAPQEAEKNSTIEQQLAKATEGAYRLLQLIPRNPQLKKGQLSRLEECMIRYFSERYSKNPFLVALMIGTPPIQTWIKVAEHFNSKDALLEASYEAIKTGNEKALKSFIYSCPHLINTTFMNGFTPLMSAVQYNRLGLINTLVQAGAQIDIQSDDGKTALMIAAIEKNIKAITILSARANLDIQDSHGETALMHALNQLDAIHLLEQLKQGSNFDIKEIVKALIEKGANVNLEDGYKETALFHLIQNASGLSADAEIAELLIDAGADVDHQNFKGVTPLLQATRNKDKELIATLLEAHADPYVENYYHESALTTVYDQNNEDSDSELARLFGIEDISIEEESETED